MITVFYGNQIFAEYLTEKEMKKDLYPHTEVQAAVYNEGYLYYSTSGLWYRPDLTPCLIEDVPKKLQMLALVLGL